MTRRLRRRDTVLVLPALGAAMLGWPACLALAQKPGPMPRVGILVLSSLPSVTMFTDSIRANLRELGYVEGSSIAYDLVSADGNTERLPELAAQLVARKVDVIIAGGGNVTTLAARKATATIPIVMTSGFGPVAAGLVQSLARPGGNVTGMVVPQELALKQLQLLQELVPSLSRVAVLLRHDAALMLGTEQGRAAAQQMMGITLELVATQGPEDLGRAVDAARAARPQAMIVAYDPLLFQQRAQILRFARAARLPDMYPWPDVVDDGGLISFTPTVQEMLRGVARFVDRLLNGAKPADLPVEQPTTFELVLNLKTARALGLKVTQDFLLRANRVID